MSGGPLTVDRLAAGAAVDVLLLDGLAVGEGPVRAPHRHDYHELIWVRAGEGEHLVDGEPVAVVPGTVTAIGRGQVHVFRQARGVHGAVLRFTGELLAGADERIAAGRLLTPGGARVIPVPARAAPTVEAMAVALAAELRRPPDPYALGVQRHLVAAVLLWLERWHDASRAERPAGDDADLQLYRRFAERLEVDFAHHHDAGHYADALAVPPAALSRALTRATGRSTKDHVLDRVLLEAARLLRFTDLTVSEVAHRTGYRDPLYFSRAFKRRYGVAPQAYRDRARGRG